MPDKRDHTAYLRTSFRRNWVSILWPALGSVGFTLLIFLTIPLLNSFSVKSSPAPPADRLNIVQLRPEKTEEKPETRPVETVFNTPPENRLVQPDKKPKPVYSEPEIRLEIDTKLTVVGPGTLLLPALDTVPMTADRALAGVFSEGQLDLPLTALVRAAPVYPIQARRRGTEGWVKVLLTVDEKGNVMETVIVDAKPIGVFEKSVERCTSRWRFKPGTVDGTPVKARIETTIEFKLASG